MQDNIEDFVCYLMSEKGLSQNTLESYQRDVQSFSDFLQAQGIVHFSEAKLQTIIDFLGLKTITTLLPLFAEPWLQSKYFLDF